MALNAINYTESEDNGDFDIVDVTYDDYNNYGVISYSDVYGTNTGDVWRISFTFDGYANFWLGNIPSGCNYELAVYEKQSLSSTFTLVGYSCSLGNSSELVTIPVDQYKQYYARIYSYGSYSNTNQYLF